MKNIVESMKRYNTALVNASGLCCHLEAYVGGYFVSGYPFEPVYDVYYDGTIDKDAESVDVIPEHLVAYATADGEYAFVLARMYDRFVKDTGRFSFQYVSATDFDTREFCIDLSGEVPEIFRGIPWIDDSFLYDENVAFDFEAYFRIDSGIRYLNPKHFSIHELVECLQQAYWQGRR